MECRGTDLLCTVGNAAQDKGKTDNFLYDNKIAILPLLEHSILADSQFCL
jgi:hypothetical protein